MDDHNKQGQRTGYWLLSSGHLLIASAFIALLFASGMGCQIGSGAARPWKNVIKIGLVLPFYGYDASTAYNVLLAAKLAIKEWNDRGGVEGHRVELVAVDDESEPQVAAYQAREMIADPAVLGVIGHLQSDTTLAAAHEYGRASLALLTLGASAEGATSLGHPAVFRLCAADADIAAAASRVMASLGIVRVAVVKVATPGYEAQAEAFIQAMKNTAMEVTRIATLSPTQREFGTLVGDINQSRAELVLYCGPYRQAALLGSALRRAMPEIRFLAGGDADSPGFVQLVGDGPPTVMYVSPSIGDGQAAERQFDQRYRHKYGASPHAYSRLAYDAAHLLLLSAERIVQRGEEVSRRAVVAELRRGLAYDGASGRVVFDEQGQRVGARAGIRLISDKVYPGLIVSEGAPAEAVGTALSLRSPRALR